MKTSHIVIIVILSVYALCSIGMYIWWLIENKGKKKTLGEHFLLLFLGGYLLVCMLLYSAGARKGIPLRRQSDDY